ITNEFCSISPPFVEFKKDDHRVVVERKKLTISRLPLDKTCNNDKILSEIQLEHEKEDELVTVVVKAVHELDCMMVVKEIENGLLEEAEKLEWWFEQDIDDEREENEEDGGGDKV
nr:hypothetical protein [Tanacetum cinerariifolium]